MRIISPHFSRRNVPDTLLGKMGSRAAYRLGAGSESLTESLRLRGWLPWLSQMRCIQTLTWVKRTSCKHVFISQILGGRLWGKHLSPVNANRPANKKWTGRFCDLCGWNSVPTFQETREQIEKPTPRPRTTKRGPKVSLSGVIRHHQAGEHTPQPPATGPG